MIEEEFKELFFKFIKEKLNYFDGINNFFLNNLDDDDFYKNGYYLTLGLERATKEIQYHVFRMLNMTNQELKALLENDTEAK